MTAQPTHPDIPIYSRPPWLPGGHLQTLYGARCTRAPSIRFTRRRVDTPDGDFLDFDWSQPPETLAPSTRHGLLIFHGLEGSSQSPYAQSLAHFFHEQRWLVVVGHFRGCSGVPNRLLRAYHSGDADDIDFMVRTVQRALPQPIRWHLAGISLGGNAMLKYLARPSCSHHQLHACAAVSAPLDLMASGKHLSYSRTGRYLYTPQFLKTMKPKIAEKARRFPGSFDAQRAASSRTLLEFDDAYTAPVHGFKDVKDYWTQASSKPVLKHIRVPTLILNALNDPFVPAWSLPLPDDVSSVVTLHQPQDGGHVGFVSAPWPGQLTWLPQRLASFFSTATPDASSPED